MTETESRAGAAPARAPSTGPRSLSLLFDDLERRGIRYVVARKFEGLPERIRGDVDIYAPEARFDDLLATCERHGFVDRSPSVAENVAGMVGRLAKRPKNATAVALRSPGTVLRLARGESAPHKQNYRNAKRYRGDLSLDLRNHLAYSSPSSGEQIRVDPAVEEQFFERRRRYGDEGFFVPSPPDELAHIVPHCVFDKGGEFSAYYVDRCDELFDRVSVDPEMDRAFRDLLSKLFFEADALVYESIAAGEYQDLRARLRRFSDY